MLLLQDIAQTIRDIPSGERQLLEWIIYTLITVVGIMGVGWVWFGKRFLKMFKDYSEHTHKTNTVLEAVSSNIRNNTDATTQLKESVKDLHNSIEKNNDFLPKLIKAITGKEL